MEEILAPSGVNYFHGQSESCMALPWDYIGNGSPLCQLHTDLPFKSEPQPPLEKRKEGGNNTLVQDHTICSEDQFNLMLVCKLFLVTSFLAECGDVETNPGPRKEAKPDKAKIMQDKVCCSYMGGVLRSLGIPRDH